MVSLPDHPWLDRVVRGRVWIPLLGVLLAGIVAAQVEILKAGASMGRSLEQTSTLTNQNEQLRGSVAALADDQRIERLAGAMGLVLPPPGAVGYLVAQRGGNVGAALANLRAPDSYAFVTRKPHNGALVTGAGTSTLPPTAGAPTPPSTTTSTSSATTTAAATSTGTTTAATTPSSTSGGTTSTAATTTSAQTTQAAPTTSQAATTSPAGTTTSPASTTGTSTQTSATGAAAIQPSDSTQSSGGG